MSRFFAIFSEIALLLIFKQEDNIDESILAAQIRHKKIGLYKNSRSDQRVSSCLISRWLVTLELPDGAAKKFLQCKTWHF